MLAPILDPRLTTPDALAAIAISERDPEPFTEPANVISPPDCCVTAIEPSALFARVVVPLEDELGATPV